MKYTLKNEYHHTQVTLQVDDNANLSPSQIAKAQRALCGMKDCLCGGINAFPKTDNNFILVHQDNGRGVTSYWLEAC